MTGAEVVLPKTQAKLRDQQAEPAGRTPRPAQHEHHPDQGHHDHAQHVDVIVDLNLTIGILDGKEDRQAGEDDRELGKQLILPPQGDHDHANGRHKLQDGGAEHIVEADIKVLQPIGRPGGELQDT